MALINCAFRSHALGIHTAINVILPQPRDWREGMPVRRWPTLWLLHGLSDDHTIWMRLTSIERYVEGLPLAVVMPAVNRSFYADMRHGAAYWTFVSEELPAVARAFFPLSSERDDNFVAGLSMGGYGAFKLALSHPDRYAAAASLSGALDIARSIPPEDPVHADFALIFGDIEETPGSGADLFALASHVAATPAPRPRLFQWCGTEDFLYDENISFRDHARSLDLDLDYDEAPGGHEWVHWDREIERVIAWLGLT